MLRIVPDRRGAGRRSWGIALAAALAIAAPARGQTPAPAPASAATPAKTPDTPQPSAAPPPPAIETFIADPQFDQGRLSPSGRYLAFVRSLDGKRSVVIYDLQDKKTLKSYEVPRAPTGRFAAVFEITGVSALQWKGEDRLVVETFTYGVYYSSTAIVMLRIPAVHVISRDGTRSPFELTIAATKKPGPAALVDGLTVDPDHVLIQRADEERGKVYKADLRDGAATLIEPGGPRVLSYKVDNDGNLVARIISKSGFGGGWRVIEGKAPGETAWTKVTEIRSKDLRALSDFEILGAAEKPAQFYVAMRPKTPADGDTTAVRIYDFATRTLSAPVWSNPKYDVVGIVQDGGTGPLLGGCYWTDIYQCDFADKALQANIKGLSKFFGGERNIVVISISADGDRWLLQVSGPDEPGSYYIYDRKARHVEMVGSRYPLLQPQQLSPTRPYAWKASDGLALSGYFTPGMGDAAGPAPLVVMPHGGPEARDHLEYDPWVQFLASRGWAVFQPNFRGSDGFGRKFAEAGYRQWGARMQDDVNDGVRALIADGKVDPRRICIAGASYGGYAALYGAATSPDLYRCAISIAGPADLLQMLDYEHDVGGEDSDLYTYWTKLIGDPKTERARIAAASPITLASTYTVPVLLIHGDQDKVVPAKQSKIMEKALRKAGKWVKYVELTGAGHSDWTDDNQVKMLTELETFLTANLGEPRPRPAPPPARDAKTSPKN